MAHIVYIGNAVCDENGKARGGQPGNQTGKELRIQQWYRNKKEWYVYRAKDPEVAEKLAYDMKAACENMAIGYNQAKRNTLYKIAKPVDFDCAKVVDLCECDCSSLVRVCLAYAGIVTKDFNTASERSVLLKTGKFEELTDDKYCKQCGYLKKGDILLTRTKGHSAIVLNDGQHVEPEPEPEPEPGPLPLEKAIRVKGSVHVRKANSILSPAIGTAINCKLIYLGQAEEAPYWYSTVFKGQGGFITSNPKYTELIDVEKKETFED